MLIQVDVDNTLYDSDACFARAAADLGLGWNLGYDHWATPEELGYSRQEMKSIFRKGHSKEYIKDNVPYDGSAEILAAIVEERDDVEIAYISDRNEQQGAALKDWLDKHGFLHSADQHVAVSKDKRDWMRRMKPDVLIDDRVRTMLLARYELSAQCVSLKFPYNINLMNEADGIYIVNDWQEIGTVLNTVILPSIHTVSREKEI